MGQKTIHPDAPTDGDGNPVHPDPDKDYHICGRSKSDRTTETNHGRERDDHAFCLLSAGHGVDRESEPGMACSNHGGSTPVGPDSPNYEHGAYSEHMMNDLSEREREAYEDFVDALDDPESAQDAMTELVAELLMKYKRSGDTRFLREARQIASEFGVIETPADQLEIDANVDAEHTFDDGTREAFREALRARRGDGS